MRLKCLLGALFLFAINVLIAARLFRIEFSAYLNSNEGTYIALAKAIASHPGDLLWFPEWDLGLPFGNTYFPGLHYVVAAASSALHFTPAHAFHAVSAFFYCLTPVCVFLFAWVLSGKPLASFLSAVLYSLFSPSAMLIPVLRHDNDGPWDLRRLDVLVRYGEAPHIMALALLPIAALFLYLAITKRTLWYGLLAGVFTAAATVANAFGAVSIAIFTLCILLSLERKDWWPALRWAGVIGVFSYLWISPFVPPSVVQAIRVNSPTVDGDHRPTPQSIMATVAMFVLLLLLFWATQRWPRHLRILLGFTWVVSAIVILGTVLHCSIVPQPHRYHLEMDLGLCLMAGYAIVMGCERLPKNSRLAVAAGLSILLAGMLRHDVLFAHQLIRRADIDRTIEYKTARLLDMYFQDRRVFVAGSSSFLYDVFTDNPQFHGGHDPMQPKQDAAHCALYLVLGHERRSARWRDFGAMAESVRRAWRQRDRSAEPGDLQSLLTSLEVRRSVAAGVEGRR